MSTKEITMTYKKVELVKTDITRIFKRYDKANKQTKNLGRIWEDSENLKPEQAVIMKNWK